MSIIARAIKTIADLNDGRAITSVDVEYYLSTSATALSGGSWSTTAPAWANLKYMWSRTKTTYSDGSTSTTNPVCITGSQGATGATGTGIESITEEYYLSTSKTALSGGSWTTTAPTWVEKKYIWTRSKIIYKNPTSTAYTTPVCDSSWEAANDVYSYYEQTKKGFEWLITGDNPANFSVSTEGVTTVAREINNKGLVTFEGLDSAMKEKISTADGWRKEGTTQINGGFIAADTVDANVIKAETIDADKLTVDAKKEIVMMVKPGGTNLVPTTNATVSGGSINDWSAVGENYAKSPVAFALNGVGGDVSSLGVIGGVALSPGQQYTLSFWAWWYKAGGGDRVGTLHWNLYHDAPYYDLYDDSFGINIDDFLNNLSFGTPTKYSFTFSLPGSVTASYADWSLRFVLFGNDSAERTFYVTDPKIETGNVATDWSPSPKDPASSIKGTAVTVTGDAVEVTQTTSAGAEVDTKIRLDARGYEIRETNTNKFVGGLTYKGGKVVLAASALADPRVDTSYWDLENTYDPKAETNTSALVLKCVDGSNVQRSLSISGNGLHNVICTDPEDANANLTIRSGKYTSGNTSFNEYQISRDEIHLEAFDSATGAYRSAGFSNYGTSEEMCFSFDNCNACPTSNGTQHLGQSGRRWKSVKATTGTIDTSDARSKHDISDIEEKTALKFIMKLHSKWFRFNTSPDSTMSGFVAQEVLALIRKYNLPIDWAIVDTEDPNEYGMRYSQLFAPLISVVQRQQRQIDDLTARLDALEKLIAPTPEPESEPAESEEPTESTETE